MMNSNEPEFHAWRKKVLTRSMVVSILAVPVGFAFLGKSPKITLIVSGLGVIGFLIAFFKLRNQDS